MASVTDLMFVGKGNPSTLILRKNIMSIDTRLNYNDILWLLKAADAWEEKESSEFYFAKQILSIPEFDENHPAYKFIQDFKKKYRGQEQNLSDKRDDVSEKASTMKAKLFFIKKQLGMAGLLDVEEDKIEDKIEDGQEINGISEIIASNEVDNCKTELSLSDQLKAAIEAEDFEKAAKIRDIVAAVEDEDYDKASKLRDNLKNSQNSEE